MWSSLSKVSPFRYSPTYGDSLTVKSNTLKQLKLWFSMLPNPISSSVNTLFFFSRSTLLGVTSSLNLILKDHIFLAKNSLKKFDVLHWFCDYFTHMQLLSLYRGLICPCLEHGIPEQVKLLDCWTSFSCKRVAWGHWTFKVVSSFETRII